MKNIFWEEIKICMYKLEINLKNNVKDFLL